MACAEPKCITILYFSSRTSRVFAHNWTNVLVLLFGICLFFLSSCPQEAQAQSNSTNSKVPCVQCPNGSKCFSNESINVTVVWGYNGHICQGHNAEQCYGESDPRGFVRGPRQYPVTIQQGDGLIFQPSQKISNGFSFKPYNVTRSSFHDCLLDGAALVPSLVSSPFSVPGRFIATTGIKYFTAKTNNMIYQCMFGLKSEVYVRSKEPCINPKAQGKGVCSDKGLCATTGIFFTLNESCVCCPGYIGQYCEELNSCAPNPCLNGGTCIDFVAGHTNEFNCSCIPGFRGKRCEIDMNECLSSPCQNGGFCLDGNNGYSCVCPPENNGVNCEIPAPNPCETLKPCKNGATCIRSGPTRSNYTCACLLEFTGRNCSDNVTSSSIMSPTSLITSIIATTVKFLDTSNMQSVSTIVPRLTSDILQPYVTSTATATEPLPTEVITSLASTASLGKSSSGVVTMTTSDRVTLVITAEGTQTVPLQSTLLPASVSRVYTVVPQSQTIYTTSLIQRPSEMSPKPTYVVSESTASKPVVHPASTSAPLTVTSVITDQLPSSKDIDLKPTITQTIAVTSLDLVGTSYDQVTPRPTSIIKQSNETVLWLSSTQAALSTYVVAESIIKSTLIPVESTLWPSSTSSQMTKVSTVKLEPTLVTSVVLFTSWTSTPAPVSSPSLALSEGVSTTPIKQTSTLTSSVMPSSSSVPTVQPTVPHTIPVINMTCADNPCGEGKCINETDLHELAKFTCECPFRSFGPRCRRDNIPHFLRFGKNSYLEHNPIKLSLALNKIVIAFKTNATNGLLLYSTHAKHPDFFQLYVTEGKLEFRFDAGDYLVSIKSEASVNTGMKVTAVITYDGKTKEGTLQVNSGTIQRKKARGDMRGIDLESNLYIGGLPLGKKIGVNDKGVQSPSLVGCITDIELNNDVLKLTEAKGWYNLGECDAPCVNQPCGNNGTCIPDINNPHDYECNCTAGFEGKHCKNYTRCQGDPCNGGRCIVPDSSKPENHVCLCSFGRAGVSCENAIKITVSGFDMLHGYASYLEYKAPTLAVKHFYVTLQFKVDNSSSAWTNSLLLYSGQNYYQGRGDDFIALGLKDGNVLLQYNLGSGLARILSGPLDKTQDWHTITAERNGREGALYVDNRAVQRGSSSGDLSGLNVYTPLYIGGIPDLSDLPIDVDFKSGFQGNLFNVAVRYNSKDPLVKLLTVQTAGLEGRVVSGSNVGNESYDECNSRKPPCLNGGNCTKNGATFICTCVNGWKGLYCSSQSRPCVDYNPCTFGSTCRENKQEAVCDCKLGRTGRTCSNRINIQKPLFKELSYMAFTATVNIRETTAISIKFTPSKENGLLFYVTNKITSRTGDFLSITLHNGYVQARYDLGSGAGLAQSKQKILLNKEVTVQVNRTAQKGSLQLDSQEVVQITSPHSAVALDVGSKYYLGGLPQLSSVNPNAVEDSLSLQDYTGCIAEVLINGTLTETGASEGRNIDNCPASVTSA